MEFSFPHVPGRCCGHCVLNIDFLDFLSGFIGPGGGSTIKTVEDIVKYVFDIIFIYLLKPTEKDFLQTCWLVLV